MKNFLLLALVLLSSSTACEDEPESTMTIHEWCRKETNIMFPIESDNARKSSLQAAINAEFFKMCVSSKAYGNVY